MAIEMSNQQVRVRANEAARRQGLTFADLCDLVDKGREVGIDPAAVIVGDTWLSNRPKGRDGYRLRWIEL